MSEQFHQSWTIQVKCCLKQKSAKGLLWVPQCHRRQEGPAKHNEIHKAGASQTRHLPWESHAPLLQLKLPSRNQEPNEIQNKTWNLELKLHPGKSCALRKSGLFLARPHYPGLVLHSAIRGPQSKGLALPCESLKSTCWSSQTVGPQFLIEAKFIDLPSSIFLYPKNLTHHVAFWQTRLDFQRLRMRQRVSLHSQS